MQCSVGMDMDQHLVWVETSTLPTMRDQLSTHTQILVTPTMLRLDTLTANPRHKPSLQAAIIRIIRWNYVHSSVIKSIIPWHSTSTEKKIFRKSKIWIKVLIQVLTQILHLHDTYLRNTSYILNCRLLILYWFRPRHSTCKHTGGKIAESVFQGAESCRVWKFETLITAPGVYSIIYGNLLKKISLLTAAYHATAIWSVTLSITMHRPILKRTAWMDVQERIYSALHPS